MGSPVTAVATTEKLAQGAYVEFSTDASGNTFNEVLGVESVPRVGVEGSFVEVQSINEQTKRYIAGVTTPPEWELLFIRIGNNANQDALIAAAVARVTVRVRITYSTGDRALINLVLNGFYADEATQGDSKQMFGIKGQQSGDPVFDKVA